MCFHGCPMQLPGLQGGAGPRLGPWAGAGCDDICIAGMNGRGGVRIFSFVLYLLSPWVLLCCYVFYFYVSWSTENENYVMELETVVL
ncbi:hypothetical protein ACSBR1_034301 [Camellia fascicularis]